MADVQQLRRVMAQIEAHPEQHDQVSWHCGTKQCFGGWACTLNGYRFLIIEPGEESTVVVDPATGHHELAETAARRLLDLTYSEAQELLYRCETRADVREYVAELIHRYGP